jgi:hypothetical protein
MAYIHVISSSSLELQFLVLYWLSRFGWVGYWTLGKGSVRIVNGVLT